MEYQREKETIMRKDKRFYTQTTAATKVLLLLTLTAFVAACAGAGAGIRVVDPVKSAANLRIQDGYTYYYDGQEHMPFTIVGLKKPYTVKTKFFTAFDPRNGKLESMVDALHTLKSTIRPVMLEVVDAGGKMVGFVYTSEHQLTVRLGADKTVYLDAPYSHGSHSGSITGN